MNLFACSALLMAAVVATTGATSVLPDANIAQRFSGKWEEHNYWGDEAADHADYVQPASIVLNTVTQRVDNFNPQNTATFEQRYYMNGEHFQPGGPLFIVLGGEWQISPFRLVNNSIEMIADELDGYMFYLEHRYYGQSFPTADVSTENLRFLTPEQALADIAHFVNHIKQRYVTPGAEDSPVIVIGLHYSANLATWFRQRYPHLALGAWASSAPLLAVVNHHQYKATAAETYRRLGGQECYDAIEAGFAQIDQLVNSRQIEQLSSIFNVCSNATLTTAQHTGILVSVFAEIFSFVTQFAAVQSVNGICRVLDRDHESPAHGIAAVLGILGPPDAACMQFDYDQLIAFERETALTSFAVMSGLRQAQYQTCTQLGWHHTSDGPQQPFGSSFPLDIFLNACEAIFDGAFTNATAHQTADRINVAHGGINPAVTNVLFSHGEMDPWRTIGVLEDLNESSPAIVIENVSQAADLRHFNPNDSQELLDARQAIRRQIRYWIAHDQGIEIEPL